MIGNGRAQMKQTSGIEAMRFGRFEPGV